MDAKSRRKALGLSRAELGAKACVDKHTLQLFELGHPVDDAAASRVTRALDAIENGEELPDFAAEVKADMAAHGSVGDEDIH